jgi:hypothetical protein
VELERSKLSVRKGALALAANGKQQQLWDVVHCHATALLTPPVNIFAFLYALLSLLGGREYGVP